jgi:hypothetical protein
MLFASLLLLSTPPLAALEPLKYSGMATFCLKKAEMDKFVAYEQAGSNGHLVFKGNPSCDSLCLKDVHLEEKLGEFRTTSGMHFWYWRGKNFDRSVDIYLAVRAVPESTAFASPTDDPCK